MPEVKKLCYIKPGKNLVDGVSLLENDDGINDIVASVLDCKDDSSVHIYPYDDIVVRKNVIGTQSSANVEYIPDDVVFDMMDESLSRGVVAEQNVSEDLDVRKGKELMDNKGESDSSDESSGDDSEVEFKILTQSSRHVRYECDDGNPHFLLGMTFGNAEEARAAIAKYSIAKCTPLKLNPNEKHRIRAKCKSAGCPFVLFMSKTGKDTGLVVKTFNSEHSCLKDSRNQLASAKFLAREFRALICDQPTVTVKELRRLAEQKMHLYVSSTMLKRAKRIVREELEGSYIKEFGEELKKKFWSCAWSSFREEFEDNLKLLGAVSKDAAEDFVSYNPHVFCRAFFSSRSKTECVDNNFCESFNASIRNARFKPIVSMLEEIRELAMTRLASNKEFVHKWASNWSPSCMDMYQENLERAFGCKVLFNGNDGYEVGDGDDRHVVRVDSRLCTCRRWDLTGIPCSHAIVAINHAKKDPKSFISAWYSKKAYMATYEMPMESLPNLKFMNVNSFEPCEPPPIIRQPGSSWSISPFALPLRRLLKLQPPPSQPSPPFYQPPAALSTLRSLVVFLPNHSYSSRSSIIAAEEASLTPSMGSQATEIEWPSKKVRETFFKFFEDKAHVNWISSPVVPHNDPTLLFANAGMNQFKPIFLGTADPNTELSKLKRACNTQKCIRAGGKHNDLDDVGKDTYHHTFFEMLGNWSFGDYFKNEAIGWAWELLTKASFLHGCCLLRCFLSSSGGFLLVYKLPTDRIYATYFGGDDKLGLPADIEARDNWLKVLPPNRVLPFGCKDNFWEMGDTGPCGPCTEIHFDRIGGRDAASFVNNDDPTVLEIWNLVFIQFNREADGSLKSLPSKHVDTGMGFERLTSVLQTKMSNYDTDIFMPIFDAIQQVNETSQSWVVADHIRTISFAIADGSRPGNEGREYVLRRILRRAVRYGTEVLKAQQGFFNGLVQVVVDVMGDVFPELKEHAVKIREIIADEEASFGRTLTKDAFDLWDTYGFPLDLTQLMAEERGLTVDSEGFSVAMDKARERSRSAQNKQSGGVIAMDADATATLHKKGVAATDDSFKFTWFQVTVYTGSEFLESVVPGEEVGIILETTSFYAEQGGIIEGPDGVFEVSNVQIYGGFVLHIGSFSGKTGRLYIGDKAVCKVDYDRRTQIAPNHTCTHILNFALRETKLADAKRVNGLRAVFGEVYPDPVRVVSVGRKVDDLLANPESEEWLSISAELCGGTHISNTREAKAFALLSEEGIAKGIRRVTAVTLDYAFKALELASSLEQEINEASKAEGSILEQKVTSLNSRVEGASIPSATKADLKAKISVLQSQVIKAKKKIAEEHMRKAIEAAIQTAEGASSKGKAYCISLVDVGSDTTAIREAVVKVMEQKGMAIMVLSRDEAVNKAFVCAGVPDKDSKYKQLNVTEWLKKVLELISGKGGGGKGGLAQGQGSDASRIEAAIDVADSFAAMKLN
ncbi:Alanyl-tRNA synthetase [Perilla frutescens var. hirtella]|nr:Alanyl-tRNA synthetase [Perilla frutescens var. hirtella]